jgi:hypothetical protein
MSAWRDLQEQDALLGNQCECLVSMGLIRSWPGRESRCWLLWIWEGANSYP